MLLCVLLCVCCSVLQRVAARNADVFKCVWQEDAWRVAVCCSVLQRAAACCSVLQRVAAYCSVLQRFAARNADVFKCVWQEDAWAIKDADGKMVLKLRFTL